MRILILGGNGMLGHCLLQHFAADHDVRVTLRGALSAYASHKLFHADNSFTGVNVCALPDLLRVFAEFRPEVVINAVGASHHTPNGVNSKQLIEVNALLPQRLAELCTMVGARLVQISTDCVFSGQRESGTLYLPDDNADASSLYGRSKFLGEIREAPGITLRSSIIGLEIAHHTHLIEWFLQQSGCIKGYTGAWYTGMTTLEMARVIEMVLLEQPDLHGVWQVASAPINKYELLMQLQERLPHHAVEIQPDQDFYCNRGLSGEAFSERTGYAVRSWSVMLDELSDAIEKREAA